MQHFLRNGSDSDTSFICLNWLFISVIYQNTFWWSFCFQSGVLIYNTDSSESIVIGKNDNDSENLFKSWLHVWWRTTFHFIISWFTETAVKSHFSEASLSFMACQESSKIRRNFHNKTPCVLISMLWSKKFQIASLREMKWLQAEWSKYFFPKKLQQ